MVEQLKPSIKIKICEDDNYLKILNNHRSKDEEPFTIAFDICYCLNDEIEGSCTQAGELEESDMSWINSWMTFAHHTRLRMLFSEVKDPERTPYYFFWDCCVGHTPVDAFDEGLDKSVADAYFEQAKMAAEYKLIYIGDYTI